jgi:hypothetical protein
MGQFGWDFIAQGTGYSTRDRLQQPHKGQAIEANNGHSGRERWWWIRRGGPNSKEGEMEARVQRDRLVRFSQGTGSTAAMAIADGNGSGGI